LFRFSPENKICLKVGAVGFQTQRKVLMALISLLCSPIRYTYGKPVEGKVHLSACRKSTIYGSCRNLNSLCKNFTTQVRDIFEKS
jgi:hypothetical protein